jgi:hypothetical protein
MPSFSKVARWRPARKKVRRPVKLYCPRTPAAPLASCLQRAFVHVHKHVNGIPRLWAVILILYRQPHVAKRLPHLLLGHSRICLCALERQTIRRFQRPHVVDFLHTKPRLQAAPHKELIELEQLNGIHARSLALQAHHVSTDRFCSSRERKVDNKHAAHSLCATS